MWVNDSQRLLLEYFDTIHNSPSQIYHSALPFSPPSSWLHKCYSVEFPQEVKVVRGLPAEWGMCFRTVTLNSTPWALAIWKDTIAVSLESGDIIILDRVTGSQTATLSGHTDHVRSIVFSPNGTQLISGSHDKTVNLWDVQTGNIIKTFSSHISWVLSVSMSVDHTMIASGSSDKTIRLWDIQTGECYHIIKQQKEVQYVRFSPMNSQHLISVSGGKVWQWDISGHQISPTYDGSCVCISSDGTQFVSCHGAAVVVQNSNSGAIMTKFHVTGDNANHCCFSPNDSLVAVTAGSTIYVWDITGLDPHIVKTFVGHTSLTTSLVFSSPSSLISSSHDQSVKFWQIGTSLVDPSETNLKSTSLTSAPIKSITLQVKDSIAISSDADGVVRTWDISTGLCKKSLQTPARDYHMSDVLLTNGRLIFVWQKDKQIYIWDVEKEELLKTVDLVQHGNEEVENVRISGDGSKVFCLWWKSIQAWSIWTGDCVGKVGLKISGSKRSLTVDRARVWVHSPALEPQGWDFGIPDSPPVQLSSMSIPHLNDTKWWDTHQSKIKDIITGKVVFQLGGRFSKPVDSQWDGQYLVAGYQSGEVLILDFNYLFPK